MVFAVTQYASVVGVCSSCIPRGLKSPRTHLIDIGIDLPLQIPRQTVNANVSGMPSQNQIPDGQVLEIGGQRRSHLRAADQSFPLKVAVHHELKFTLKTNNYLNIFKR